MKSFFLPTTGNGARKTRNGGKPGFCESKNAPIKKSPATNALQGIEIKFMLLQTVCGYKDTGCNCGSDNARNVGAHCIHQEEV